MRVYPAAGLLCRDPVKKDLLPESGRDVPDGDHFWLRRIADGDVVTQPPKPTRAVIQPTAVIPPTLRSNDE